MNSLKRKRDDGDDGGKNANDACMDHDSICSIELFFDGGSRGNPGNAGSGAHIQITRKDKDDKRNIGSGKKQRRQKLPKTQTIQIRHYCGKRETNNVAEYSGLLEGLKEVKKVVDEYCRCIERDNEVKTCAINLEIRGDSDLIMKQLSGVYSVKKDTLKKLFKQCTELIAHIQGKTKSDGKDVISVSVNHAHVYRKYNKIADSKYSIC